MPNLMQISSLRIARLRNSRRDCSRWRLRGLARKDSQGAMQAVLYDGRVPRTIRLSLKRVQHRRNHGIATPRLKETVCEQSFTTVAGVPGQEKTASAAIAGCSSKLRIGAT